MQQELSAGEGAQAHVSDGLAFRPGVASCTAHLPQVMPSKPPRLPASIHIAEDGKDAGGAGAAATTGGSAQQRMSDYVLPACDSKALCAYLGLFRCAVAFVTGQVMGCAAAAPNCAHLGLFRCGGGQGQGCGAVGARKATRQLVSACLVGAGS